MKTLQVSLVVLLVVCAAAAEKAIPLANLVPAWEALGTPKKLPIAVDPFTEHVGSIEESISATEADGALSLKIGSDGQPRLSDEQPRLPSGGIATAYVNGGAAGEWFGTDHGLFFRSKPGTEVLRHEQYGVEGPLATRITALAQDSRGVLWVGTPLGLSLRSADGKWRHIRGHEGLPVEDVAALAIDRQNNVWIGTSKGAVLHRPYGVGRRWFYRQGPRYLPGDRVRAIALVPEGMPAYFLTDRGVGRMDAVTTTLERKARTIERLVKERHRRFGLVADCTLDDARKYKSHMIGDNDNDGLWTAYHVTAMALCYGATKDEAAKASAREGMRALYLLQNASGTPGLVARSVLPVELGKTRDRQWQPTPDGKFYWKSDTSSDEIDGHYMAFYAYYEHMARHDPAEKELCIRQVRAVTDYILDHNYQLIDWTGKRTRWGFWNPESLNDDPENYLENGLNSLQMLSFLKVAHYVTGDSKYDARYQKLIREHGYLSNAMLSKKVFPDEDNHSDNQLGFVGWYPILQLERDPVIRSALLRGVRRHYEVVKAENSAFFTFVYATVDPDYANIGGAIENLRQIPTDRRLWRQENSHRADVTLRPRANRFGRSVLLKSLPVDEYSFAKWNADPYVPDAGGDGRGEDDGAAYLLPYWMGRWHGLIAESPAPAISP
ncbi:MAG: two-component regulator propeller domain-containing protein [Verrucomicrobiota bacterium]